MLSGRPSLLEGGRPTSVWGMGEAVRHFRRVACAPLLLPNERGREDNPRPRAPITDFLVALSRDLASALALGYSLSYMSRNLIR